MKAIFYPLGDKAVIIQFGTNMHKDIQMRVQQTMKQLQQYPFAGFVECVPAYTNVTVYYNPCEITKLENHYTIFDTVVEQIKEILKAKSDVVSNKNNIIHIPVCYEKKFAPDIEKVAAHNHLTVEEVIQLHTASTYTVHMIGFSPGFPFIGGMDKRIATPRRSTPRQSIPAGSVGIAGEQTGVYPIATPGGWNLIGRTPKQLFLPKSSPPTLLSALDEVMFYKIDGDTYYQMKKEEESYGH